MHGHENKLLHFVIFLLLHFAVVPVFFLLLTDIVVVRAESVLVTKSLSLYCMRFKQYCIHATPITGRCTAHSVWLGRGG